MTTENDNPDFNNYVKSKMWVDNGHLLNFEDLSSITQQKTQEEFDELLKRANGRKIRLSLHERIFLAIPFTRRFFLDYTHREAVKTTEKWINSWARFQNPQNPKK